jgi:glycerophosphoryl diester phosphodiesterase
MKFWKTAALLLSGVGLYSVANYSAEIANVRARKKIFEYDHFWIIAHRGFSGRYPENTMLSFEQAAALGVDSLEFDVRATRDGKIVVIHDSALDRTTNLTGRVSDRTWDEVKRADAGYHFDPDKNGKFPFRNQGVGIPLLENVFKSFPHMKMVVEIKQTMPAIEEQVYRLIRKYQMEDKVILASEYYEPLARFRDLSQQTATSLSAAEAVTFYQLFRMHMANFYHSFGDAMQIPPEFRGKPVVTPAFVKAIRRKGMILHVWTVNDPEQMEHLIKMGVDGIITDFPDRLIQVSSRTPKAHLMEE